MLSFGEAWYAQKKEVNSFDVKFDAVPGLETHQKRMNKKDAAIYYTKKCKRVFENLGMTKKNIKSDFEIRLPIIIEKVRKKTNVMIVKEARKINNEYFREVA